MRRQACRVLLASLLLVAAGVPSYAQEAAPPVPYARLADLIPPNHPCRKYFPMVFAGTARKFQEPLPLLFISQFFQESRCNSAATSKVGAAGIGQIMPKTQADLEKHLGTEGDIRDAAYNIDLALTLDYQYRKMWSPTSRPYCDRLWLMLAGYNGGPGYWIKSQKVCLAKTSGTCNNFSEMAQYLPQVNSSGAKENLGYPTIISKNWAKMESPGACVPVDATQYLKGTP
jgi:hypothetical protein